jgi:3-phenylpropionate/cinnamic acid dioxygenase small subunit
MTLLTLDDLLAREGIRDTVARYNSYSDAGRFDQLWELFAEDAVMELGPKDAAEVYDGREQIKRIFLGAQERVQGQVEAAGATYIRHFTATHQIDLIDADHASGRCYFAVIIDKGVDHWGRYIDRYVRIEGAWRFHHRRVIVEGRADSSWFAS